jgi:hypothetical protein
MHMYFSTQTSKTDVYVLTLRSFRNSANISRPIDINLKIPLSYTFHTLYFPVILDGLISSQILTCNRGVMIELLSTIFSTLISWTRILLEELMVVNLEEIFPPFMDPGRTYEFIRARHWMLPRAS